MTLAKYESANTPSSLVTAFDQVARDIVADLLPAARGRAIDLGFERLEGVMVHADTTTLAVLIRNLVDNALRYTPDGGRVDIHLYVEHANAFLCVEDSGPGIPDAELERVFEPFYRGGQNESEGTGLGLSIVHRIVSSLSGSVALENIPAPKRTGLRAVVTIPAATMPADAGSVEAA